MTTPPPEPNNEQAAPQYQQPPADAYQQPPAAPVANPLTNIQLNYWLSVFFTWIPALIFYIIEKDKGDRRALEFHIANLNFALVRTGALIAVWILGTVILFIPYIGWLISMLLWLAILGLAIVHLISAVKVTDSWNTPGGKPWFLFNIPMVK